MYLYMCWSIRQKWCGARVRCLKALSKTGALALSTFENVILWVTVMKIKDFLGLIWLEIMSDIYKNKNINELRHV